MNKKPTAFLPSLRKGILFAMLLALLLPNLAWAQTPEHPPVPQSSEELSQTIQEMLDKYNIPGAGLVVVTPDGVQTFAFGIADLASNTPVTPETRFRIGSISKTFVALAALQLVEAGELSLDDRLADVAPEVKFNNRWEESHPVRLVNLLEHTAGFGDLHLSDFNLNRPEITLQDGLAIMEKSLQSGWSPNRYFLYSSAGTSAAAYMVEKAGGQDFEAYVQQHIFTPLEMASATYIYPSDGNIAASYDIDGQTLQAYRNIIARPAGSINATPGDMSHLIQFLLARGNYNGQALLNPASVERMETPATTLAAQNGIRLGYGLCNMTTVQDGFIFHGHSGSIDGFLSDYGYLPEEGVGYFLSINAMNFQASQELSWLLRAYLTRGLSAPAQPDPVPAGDLNEFTGFYIPATPQMSPWSFAIERFLLLLQLQPAEDHLLVKPLLGEAVELTPLGGGLFRTPGSPAADSALAHGDNNRPVLQITLANYTFLPAWQAGLFLGLGLVTNLFILSVGLYFLAWLPMWLRRKLRPGRGALRLRFLPLLALICLVGFNGLLVGSLAQSEAQALHLLGTPSAWAISITILSILFALFSLAALLQSLLTLLSTEIVASLRVYTLLTSLSLVIVAIYLTRYGLIGLMTWK